MMDDMIELDDAVVVTPQKALSLLGCHTRFDRRNHVVDDGHVVERRRGPVEEKIKVGSGFASPPRLGNVTYGIVGPSEESVGLDGGPAGIPYLLIPEVILLHGWMFLAELS
jgi:hypothetical protein